jgi:hypothetical protein
MSKALLIVLFIFTALASVAEASLNDDSGTAQASPTLAGLSAELKVDTASLPGLNETMATTTEANISLRKEAKVYIDDMKEKRALAEAATKRETDRWNAANMNPYNERVSQYKAECTGTFPQPKYDSCMDWFHRLQEEDRQLQMQWKEHAAEWNKANIDPIADVIRKQAARLVEIDEQTKKNFKVFTEAQDLSLSLRKRIKVIEATFRNACSSKSAGTEFTRAEMLKWCTNVNWDGASEKLVPMYTYQGTGGVSRN